MVRQGARAVTVLLVTVGLWVVVTAALVWSTGGSLAQVRSPGLASLDALLGVAAAIGAWACLTWLALGVILQALVAWSGQAGGALAAVATGFTPAVLRRATAAALGVAVLSGPLLSAGSASAATRHASATVASSAAIPGARPSVAADATGGADSLADWSPDRPALPSAASAATSRQWSPRGDMHRPRTVVRRGDTLWAIAARRLGRVATNRAIDQEWRRWYAANKSTIGADPDLLHPGQVLFPPSAGRSVAPRA